MAWDIKSKRKYKREWMRKRRNSDPKYRISDIKYAKKWQEEHKIEYLYGQCRRNALKRNYSFELMIDEFEVLINSNCNYCGCSPSPLNGIDRVDNSLGYTQSNSVASCFVCNRAKSIMSINEFNNWIIRVYNHLIKK